jgi:uncharacterized protein (TIRG00374 family)
VPSVIIAKTTITIAQGLFLLLGLAVAWLVVPTDARLLWAMVVLLVLLTIGVTGFVIVQIRGGLGGNGGVLSRFSLLARAAAGVGEVEGALRDFYTRQQPRLLLSIFFHLLGWVLSAAETWVILQAVGRPVSPATAVVIEAFGTGFRFASFMVPGHIGVLEGGHVATFVALGLDGSTGLAFTLVRRVRELAWTGLGMLILVGFRFLPRLAVPAPLEPEA